MWVLTHLRLPVFPPEFRCRNVPLVSGCPCHRCTHANRCTFGPQMRRHQRAARPGPLLRSCGWQVHLEQNVSGESNRPLTPIHVKKYRDTPPISMVYFCKSMPSVWQKVVYTPPICITIRLPFVSRYFCGSIRVRGRWDTPKCCLVQTRGYKARKNLLWLLTVLKAPLSSVMCKSPPCRTCCRPLDRLFTLLHRPRSVCMTPLSMVVSLVVLLHDLCRRPPLRSTGQSKACNTGRIGQSQVLFRNFSRDYFLSND